MASIVTSNPVSEFSPDGKLFAIINNQGILTIWDTETNELKQSYTPNLHLTSPCTSLTWVVISAQKRGSKEKSKKDRKSIDAVQTNQLYLAFGTSKGGVALYSYSSAKIERNFTGEGHSCRVASIISDKGDFLYTCGDNKIIIWSIPDEKQVGNWLVGNEKPNTMLFLPQSKSILIGSRQLKQYSIGGQELLNTFIGHSSEVTILKHFEYNYIEYVVSSSKMDRVLNLWTIKKGNKYKNATSTLLMEDIAHCISCQIVNGETLQVVAVTRSGVIHFYMKNFESFKPDKPIKPKVTIEIVSEISTAVEQIPAIAASLNFGPSTDEILLGYGDSNFLCFERMVPSFAEKRQILIRNNPKRPQKSGKKIENNLKLVTPIISPNDVEFQSSINIARKQNKTIEIPMETRIENISISKGQTPQAQSKVQLLVQALHSKDANLLRTVLANDDEKVIDLTLQKLPIQYVGSLVNELTSLMEKKRMNVQIAGSWLKILVRTHSSQLMALGNEELLEKFGPCLGIIEHRQSCLKELAKVNGRLELLVSQIKRNTEEENLKSDNLLVYEDADSSNSDFEDDNVDNMDSSSDDQWAEENDLDEDMDVSEKE